MDFFDKHAKALEFDKVLEKLSGRDIDGWLYNANVVAAALIVYGVLFIVIEKFNDERREEYLNAIGITIIRFENKDIWCSTEQVIETIREFSSKK